MQGVTDAPHATLHVRVFALGRRLWYNCRDISTEDDDSLVRGKPVCKSVPEGPRAPLSVAERPKAAEARLVEFKIRTFTLTSPRRRTWKYFTHGVQVSTCTRT